MSKIFVSEVLAEVNKVGSVFSVGFYKSDGSFTTKEGVTNRSKIGQNQRKKMNRNGLLNCYLPKTGEFFDCTIDLIMTFNGMEIIRPTK